MKEVRYKWLVLGLIAGGLCFAWFHRHLEDDAFITFRYSKHMAEGLGPVWNADQRVEGYTNFLWMLLMAIPIGLGLDVTIASVVVSLGFLALNLWLLFRIVLRQTADPQLAFWVWLPVMCSHTMLFFTTSGLETSMNGCLWTIALWWMQAVLKSDTLASAKQAGLLGLVCAVSILSRPEGALLTIMCCVAILYKASTLRLPYWRRILNFVLPLCMLLIPWLIWKMAYYGEVLPNTFFVKTQSVSLRAGLKYVGIFLVISGFWIPEIFRALAGRSSGREKDVFLQFWLILTVAFLGYTAWVGGDYLEFRLLTPVIPGVILISGIRLARRELRPRFLPAASMGMVLIALFWGQGHGRLFEISQMNSLVHDRHATRSTMSFPEQGKAFGNLLDHDKTIRLAIGASGAIPYYSEFYGIDLYGLNEPLTEFTSYPTNYGPGHAKLADFAFLRLRGPNLISLRCDYVPNLAPGRTYRLSDPQVSEVTHGIREDEVRDLKIIELPIAKDFVEVCIYYRPHPKIETILKNNALKIYELE